LPPGIPAQGAPPRRKCGDGIMSAIDFSMDISRVEDTKGDRVKFVLNGKFLPYKMY
jgi:cyanate lyase